VKHIDEITQEVIGVAMRIHSELGPGLLETVYETVLAGRLLKSGYHVVRQKPIDIEFEELSFPAAFRIDILIDERLILEIKSVETLHSVHAKHILTYLRLMKLPVGLILNFGEATMRQGIRRYVNDHKDSAASAPLREKF
jgi:GxxExxY protein